MKDKWALLINYDTGSERLANSITKLFNFSILKFYKEYALSVIFYYLM